MSDRAPRGFLLCTGIAVRDLVFTVVAVPPPGTKAEARSYSEITGGNAVNAAIGIAKLGGAVSFAGPLGGPDDAVSDRMIEDLRALGIGTDAVMRVDGARAPVSSILIDSTGERTIATWKHPALAEARHPAPAKLVEGAVAVVADNKVPAFSAPILAAGRARGVPVVLDADRALDLDGQLARAANAVVFSAEGLLATFPGLDLNAALAEAADRLGDAITGVTEGEKGVVWIEGGRLRHAPAPVVKAVDTLGAGDVFHGALALALSEGAPTEAAMRFASVAAALKCRSPGGAFATPSRGEVEDVLRNSFS